MDDDRELGQYRLVARLATGGMAELFLASRDGPAGFKKAVAIKRLLPHLAREARVVEMFLNEARLASRLDHPNIVQVFDLGRAGGDYFLAMELLDGRTLAELLEASAARAELVPLGVTVRVLSDALAGLHAAHEAHADDGSPLGVVHRDFNPTNLFVTYDGRVKVLDFGIAKIQSLSAQSEPGMLRGKYFYMSPEMVTAQPVDRRADLFATGVTLYEILTGRRPFEADEVRALISKIAVGAPVPPSRIDPGVPPALDSLCMRLLRKDPAARPQTAALVRDELERFLSAAGQPVAAAELSAYMNRLFPPGDPERRRIAELRGKEPTPSHGVIQLGPENQRRPEEAAAPAPAGPPRAPVPAHAAPRRAPWPPFGLAALVLAVGVVLWLRPRAPAPASGDGLAQARVALLAGRLDEAQAAAERRLTQAPDDAAAHALLGRALAAGRHGRRAEVELRRAIQLAPRGLEAYRALAELKLAEGDAGSAQAVLEGAHRIDPADPAASEALAAIYGQRAEWKKEETLLEGVVRKDMRNAGAIADLGFAQFQLGELARGSASIARALEIAPRLAKAHYYLGFVEYRRGHVQKAVASYRTAADLDPRSPAALIALGDLYRAEHDDAKARDADHEAAGRGPTGGAGR